MSMTTAAIDPKQAQRTTYLGTVSINGVSADLFVQGSVIVAQVEKQGTRSAPLRDINALSDVYLLIGFRLYLDARGLGKIDQ